MRTQLCPYALAALAGLAISNAALAQQTFFNYVGPNFGDWNVFNNWTPNGIPGSAAMHVALVPGGRTVRLGLSAPAQRTIDKIQIDMGGQVELLNDADLTIRTQTDGLGITGLLNVPGILFLSSVGNSTDLIFSGPANSFVTFGGGVPGGAALIQMSNNIQNRIYGTSAVERLDIQPGAVIAGSGQVGLNQLQINNAGTIRATSSTGITIDPNGAGLVNTGTLLANGGVLTLVPSVYNNAGGTIQALASDVVLFNCDITGGQLVGSLPGVIRAGVAGAGTVIRDVTLNGTMRMPNDADVIIANTLANNGSLEMQSLGNATDIYLGTSLLLTGGGSIIMGNNIENRILDVTGGQGGRTLTNQGNTIRGAGQIGLNTISIVNQPGGSIIAEGSAGLQFDPGNNFTNQGVLRAATGSFLNLVAGNYAFTAPAVAATGGTIFLSAGSFTGTIDTEGTGVCRINAPGFGVSLNTLTNLGTLLFPNDTDAIVSGTLNNQGTINLQSLGNSTDIYLASDLSLTGGGSIVMGNNMQNRILDVSGIQGGRTLTNADNTIRGAGQIGLNTISIVNQPGGSIIAEGLAGLQFDPGNNFTNQGVLRAATGNVTILPGTFSTSGIVIADPARIIQLTAGTWSQTDGNVIANGRIQVDSADYRLFTGTLSGTGRVAGNVNNTGGTIAPGSPSGTLTIEGSYTQGPDATFDFEVGSLVNPTLNDSLNVIGGSATLNGTLRIRRSPGFIPPPGSTFTVLTTGSNLRMGTFTIIDSPDVWTIQYFNNAAVAVFNGIGTPACLVDFNADGFLTQDDVSGFLTAFLNEPTDAGPSGTSAAPCPGEPAPYNTLGYAADYNRDCSFNQEDLSGFITEYLNQIETPNGCVPG